MLTEQSISTQELAKLQNSLLERLDLLKGKKLIVLGDIGLDEYVLGDVKRISPEAPVPVLEVGSQDQRLGLAANVAQNVSSLGGESHLVAVIGADATGEQLKAMLKKAAVNCDSLVVDPSRPTTRKLRVMAGQHHIVRVDFEHRKFLSPAVEEQVFQKVQALIGKCDGIIIEDYAKGVLSESLCQKVIAAAKKAGKKVILDPNRATPHEYYRGVDLLTPNRDEAWDLSGLDLDDLRESSNSLFEVGDAILRKIEAEHLVITRGKEGMSLFSGGKVTHLPTYARQVFDVTGAGDTVIAAMMLAWMSGFTLVEACILSNFAAGVVVGKVGCVPCTIPELKNYMEEHLK